jgi:hypothetical protein
MIGKSPLWAAKQHGHSIAAVLRAYAAWAEGTAEVDAKAIKRSMNASESPATLNLAVNLSVAEALETKSMRQAAAASSIDAQVTHDTAVGAMIDKSIIRPLMIDFRFSFTCFCPPLEIHLMGR